MGFRMIAPTQAPGSFPIKGPFPVIDLSHPSWGAVSGQDATTALTAAFSVLTTNGGGRLYLRGDWAWIFDTFTPPNNVEIFGDGIGYTTIQLKAGVNSYFVNVGNTSRVILHDFTVDGNGTNNSVTGNYGIFGNTGTTINRLIAERVRVQNCAADNVNLSGTPTNCEFDKCELDGDGAHSFNNLYVSASAKVERCIFTNTTGNALTIGDNCTARGNVFTTTYGAIAMTGNNGLAERNTITYVGSGTSTQIGTHSQKSGNKVTKNDIYCGGKAAGIHIGGTGPNGGTMVGCSAEGNYVDSPNLDGILTGHDSTDVDTGLKVIGNTVYNATGGPAIEVGYGTYGTEVVGNTVSTSALAGIYASGFGANIHSNSLYACAQSYASGGAMMIAGSNVSVGGNTIRNTGASGYTTYGILFSNNNNQNVSHSSARNNDIYDDRATPYMTNAIYAVANTGGGYTVDNIDVEGNNVQGATSTKIVIDSSVTNARVRNNPGYNPVGQSAVTVPASPATITAGNSPETHYIYGGTVSNISLGVNQIASASPAVVNLEPGQSYVVTYSAAPTIMRDVH